MEDYSPESMPFDKAYSALPTLTKPSVRGALVDVCDTVDMAKRILMQNRVRQFTAADVVELTRIILERENVLMVRESGE